MSLALILTWVFHFHAEQLHMAQDPGEAACRAKIKRLGQGVKLYMMAHGGKMPGRLSELYAENYVEKLGDFVCKGSPPGPKEIDARAEFVLGDRPGVLVREKEPNHKPGEVLAFTDKGAIEFVAATEKKVPDKPDAPDKPVVKEPEKPVVDKDAIARGHAAFAKREFEEAAREYAAAGDALLEAEALVCAGEAERALQALEKAGKDPAWVFALRGLQAFYKHEPDYDTKRAMFAKAKQKDAKLGTRAFKEAQAMLAIKNHERAMVLLEIVQEAEPDLHARHFLTGQVWMAKGQPESARGHFENYLDLEPNGEFAAEARKLLK
jgi:hypothetical protein